jgi:hypothetical protein
LHDRLVADGWVPPLPPPPPPPQLILNATDPAEQLAWLSGVLAKAYASKEIVYIIGHIPFSTP